ncbi:glycerol kinase [Herbaspirillum rubrisubalbicans]|uniref:ATP:glycerol 3-phosphotransferase n=1 Tax=Herbaspirillum rubrisubalbicans TaxID=80842 RepID=A0ABX9BYU0_9BURK|nr:FGGY family carbohydrate kinase [Herbaspirillum rubrisubalbicans]RAM63167.1 glycerol kinase [Herbaspirillum rubrisubalbicans]RAN44299.1 glycerol kinase [Herbaspirillum rubrisubalbicans]
MRIAAIDQGTSSTRCLVVDSDGQWSIAAARKHARFHPHAGWVEHDPEELLHNIRAVLDSAGTVDTIAICNQGESCLAWDAKTGRALSQVIVWQDARTADELAKLGEHAGQRSKAVTGLPLDPYFSASKLSWLINNIPAVATALKEGRLRLGTTDAFFLDRLCGTFATDWATASRTGLFDLKLGQWSNEMCELHGVPKECLPEIRDVNAGFGDIDGTPVQVSIVDQQAALYGHNCRKSGDSKITFGTGAFFLAVTGEESVKTNALLPTIAWKKMGENATYAIEGGVYDAGAALDWARHIGFYSALEELNHFEGPTALSRGIVFVPALSGLAAPYWDRTATPLFIGMDHATDRRDMARAVLEGIAMLTAKLIAAASESASLSSKISIDGGLSQSTYFAKFLACACKKTITVPSMYELSALGLAGLCGMDVEDMRGTVAIHQPDDMVSDHDHTIFAAAVERARAWRAQVA